MIDNVNKPLFELRGQTVNKWGKDQTGLITYKLNNQGFRSSVDYTWLPDFAFFGASTVFGIGVPEDKTMVSYFPNAHNYGLAGNYLNRDSIVNLKNFITSTNYHNTKIIFFWVDRPGQEDISELIKEVEKFNINIKHISQGKKYPNAINLMPQIDSDVSSSHPGVKTHMIWAKTIKLMFK